VQSLQLSVTPILIHEEFLTCLFFCKDACLLYRAPHCLGSGWSGREPVGHGLLVVTPAN
jgi:hypothetical protein